MAGRQCKKGPLLCAVGSLGTAGRQCKKGALTTEGCDIMCCGRGFDTVSVQRVRKCECKFHWCCAVKCKDCFRQTDVHTCKGGGGAGVHGSPGGRVPDSAGGHDLDSLDKVVTWT